MRERTCSECGKSDWRIRRGLCNADYERMRRNTGKVVRPSRASAPPRAPRVCSECGDKHFGLGLCRKHWAELDRRRRGIQPRQPAPAGCSEFECDGEHYAKGLCHKHYQRKRLGSKPAPAPVEPRVLRGHWHDEDGVTTVHWPPAELPWACPVCDLKILEE